MTHEQLHETAADLLHGKVQHGANDGRTHAQAHDIAHSHRAAAVLDAAKRRPLLALLTPQRGLQGSGMWQMRTRIETGRIASSEVLDLHAV